MSFISTFHFVEIETSDQDARVARDRENASRPAVVEIQQESSGTGQYRLTKPVIFPLVFRTEPHLTTGSAVISGPDTKKYNDPRGSAGVWGWKRDGAGYYQGAYLWLRVDCDTLDDGDTAVTAELRKTVVRHYLSFSGVAIKAISTKKLNPNLTPRTVGL